MNITDAADHISMESHENIVKFHKSQHQAALDDIKAAAWDEKVKARKALDEVLKEAVWWASKFIYCAPRGNGDVQSAIDFLDSDLVKEYRTRQGKEPVR